LLMKELKKLTKVINLQINFYMSSEFEVMNKLFLLICIRNLFREFDFQKKYERTFEKTVLLNGLPEYFKRLRNFLTYK
jgi:hypothetical protein